ncbi:hypothetical protein M422DRAFT_243231 [Sphaerobolus stellatus SS14]|nr:hypothetical protein M422DRAFT_243231 [Sphaerobolus stellatus SS14]
MSDEQANGTIFIISSPMDGVEEVSNVSEIRVSHWLSLSSNSLPDEEPFLPSSPLCLNGKITRRSSSTAACGGYSDVYTGQLDNSRVVIKIMLCSESDYEIPALISPWMANGPLDDYIANRPEKRRLPLVIGVAEGLRYLHQEAIVHGDLRARNVLVSDSGIPYLCDFGLSRVLHEQYGLTTSQPVGSIRWMAPERFKVKASKASDVWAYGMTLLEIISGNPPFVEICADLHVYARLNEGGKPSRPSAIDAPELTENLWNICLRCWIDEPDSRIAMSSIVERLGFITVHY